MKTVPRVFVVLIFILTASAHDCVHDHFAHNTTKHFYDDLTDARLLQTAEEGR